MRSLLMIWGIAVHASTLDLSPALKVVARLSGVVRMEGFMTISGLLVGLLLERYGPKLMLRRRLVALGVPLVTCLLLLNPVTNYLAYCFHNPPIAFDRYLAGGGDPRADGPMYWHLHLWFLISLVAYAVVTPALHAAIGRGLRHAGAALARRSAQVRFGLIAAAVPVACLGTRVGFEFLLEPVTARPLVFLVRSTLYYLPFYALGLVLFRSAPLLAAFVRIPGWHLLGAVAAAVAARFLPAGGPKPHLEAVRLLTEAYLAVALIATLFALARRFFARGHRAVTYFADAAYTIYLLHFLVLYLTALGLRPLLGDTVLLAGVVMLLTFAVTLAVHHFLIRPVPLLRLLFNGRWHPRTAPAARPDARPDSGPPATDHALQTSRP